MSKAALESSKNMMKQVCKNKSGVKQEWLNMAAKGEFPNERKFKCYVACVLNMAQAVSWLFPNFEFLIERQFANILIMINDLYVNSLKVINCK